MSIKKNTKHIHRQWQKEKASKSKSTLLIFVSMLKKAINFYCVSS